METTSPVTPKEKSQLGQLVKSFNEFRDNQYAFNQRIGGEIVDISRGLYGDEKNGQVGLIQRQAEDERNFGELGSRVKKVEVRQYKTGVWLGVGSAALIGIGEFFRSLWK